MSEYTPKWVSLTTGFLAAMLILLPAPALATRPALPASGCGLPGDFDDDGQVSGADLALIADAWGLAAGDSGWQDAYDLRADGRIDVADVMLAASHFGQRCLNLADANDFLYQLQNLDLTAIGETAYDLVIMDYSADGDDATAFSAAEINALRHSPGGEKIVLAYLSIGEAEDYRWYWNADWDANHDGLPDTGAPAWLDIENPDWEGNYKVRYWDAGWQALIAAYLDKLLAAGYDGAYLDIIDAYEYYANQNRATAAQEMADFVAALRAHAHTQDADFYIFPQNAPELADLIPGYLARVDGIGQEDIYYGYNADDVTTPPAETVWLESQLDLFTAAGKPVLTVDYATTPAKIDNAYAKSQAKGYVPFVTVRDLDQLTINAGHEPD